MDGHITTSDVLLALGDVGDDFSCNGLIGMLLSLSRGATSHRSALVRELFLFGGNLGDHFRGNGSVTHDGEFLDGRSVGRNDWIDVW